MKEGGAVETEKDHISLEKKYEIIEESGRGGSGTVYKALDKHLNCYVAIKEFHKGEEALEKEMELLKGLKHPALPHVMDYLEVKERKYLVMEYIEGMTLENYVSKFGRIGQEQAVAWTLELAKVLTYLHGRNEPVIYQDMKPSNVMVNDRGEVRLIDFGSAYLKYRESGSTYICAGTYGYAAPEQFGCLAREGVDERSDVYGLGATLHYMLTGNDPSLPPFVMQPLRFYNAALSSGLEKIVKRATEKEKEKRYQSIGQMEEALKKQKGTDKWKVCLYKAAEILYYFLLVLSGGIFLKLYGLAERYGTGGKDRMGEMKGINWWTGYGGQALLAALFLFFLCMLKGSTDKIRQCSCKNVRQVKAVYLSAKKNRGLMAVICTVIALAMFAVPGTASEREELLPVVVKNAEGQKILIRYDAVYCPDGDMKLEVPADNFTEGEEYVLRLECINIRTEEMRSRTFYLKGGKP